MSPTCLLTQLNPRHNGPINASHFLKWHIVKCQSTLLLWESEYDVSASTLKYKAPWVKSETAYRRDPPEVSCPLEQLRHLATQADLWWPGKTWPYPCSEGSCSCRTDPLQSDERRGDSSAGCERWCAGLGLVGWFEFLFKNMNIHNIVISYISIYLKKTFSLSVFCEYDLKVLVITVFLNDIQTITGPIN